MGNFKKIIILVFAAAFILAGCESKESTTREDMLQYQLGAESLMAEGDYPNLYNLMGQMTYQDLFNVLSGVLHTMNTLTDLEEITPEDGASLLAILNNLYNMMEEDKARYEATADQVDPEGDAMAEASDAMIALLSQAARPGQNPGVLLDQLINQLGRDNSLLTERLYPMLEYLIAVDEDTLKDALGGGSSITVSGLDDYDNFRTVMGTVSGMLEEDGKYAGIYTTIGDLLQALEDNDLGITVGDVRDLLDDLLDSSETKAADGSRGINLSDGLIDSILDGLADLWDTDQTAIEANLADLLIATANLLTYSDGEATDFEKILDEVIRISDPGVLNRTDLEAFVETVMDAMDATADAAATKGMLNAVASLADYDGYPDSGEYDRVISNIDTGLVSFFTHNMFRADRAADVIVGTGINGEGDEFVVEMSQLRSLCMLMKASNTTPRLLGIPVLTLMKSGDGDMADATNMGEWTVGEIVLALKAARAYNDGTACAIDLDINEADFDGDGAVTPFEAFDWVLFRKNYNMLGLNIAGLTAYDGLIGMMQNTQIMAGLGVISHTVFDAFPAFLELAGGEDGGDYSVDYGTAGQRHTLFALFAGLMEFFWDNGRVLDMNGLLEAMNEIDCQAYHDSYKLGHDCLWDDVFVNDSLGYIMKTIEGENGRGLPYYALREHGDGGIMDPVLKLLVMVLNNIDIDALVDELLDSEKAAAGEGVNLDILDDVSSFLVDNKAALVAIAPALADVLREVAASLPDLVDDLTLIADSVEISVEEGEGESDPDGLIDYLTAENPDGSDNAFMANAKWLLYRMLDIEDATYNPKGTLTDESTLSEVFKRVDALYGDGLDNLMGFVSTAAGMTDELYTLIFGNTDEKATLERIMGDEELPFSFVQALFKGVDTNGDGVDDMDSVVLQLLKVLSIENVSMESLMPEIVQLMSGSDMKPGSESYDMLLDTLSFVVGNSHSTNIK